MNYGKAIRTIRASRGITQTQLTKTSGFSSAYISKIEDGQRIPPAESLQQIATALDVPLELLELLAADPNEIKSLPPDRAQQLAQDLLTMLAKDGDDWT